MTAGQEQLLALILSAMAVIFIPLMVMLYHGIVKWTRVESKLEELTNDIRELVADKEKTHAAMIDTMSKDRDATDRRLRWLEENIWKRSRPNAV